MGTGEQMTIALGGLWLRLEIGDLAARAQARLRRDYACFCANQRGAETGGVTSGSPPLPPDVDVTVEMVTEDGPPFLLPAAGEQSWRIETRQVGTRLWYRSYCEQGWLDLTARRGRLVLRERGQAENYLRVATARLALARGGLLLHASGVIWRGRGYAFFGYSGAGKSTAASLAPPEAVVVSDDLVLLRIAEGQVWLHGVPFRGELQNAPRVNAAAPLAALLALRQGPSHCLCPVPHAVAAAGLLAATPFVAGDSSAQAAALAMCTEAARRQPVHELTFARDPGFWPLLAALPQSAGTESSAPCVGHSWLGHNTGNEDRQ